MDSMTDPQPLLPADQAVPDLLKLAVLIPIKPVGMADDTEYACPYEARPAGIVYIKSMPDGDHEIFMTNFTAQIIGVVRLDDGMETATQFTIEAHVGPLTRTLA